MGVVSVCVASGGGRGDGGGQRGRKTTDSLQPGEAWRAAERGGGTRARATGEGGTKFYCHRSREEAGVLPEGARACVG